MKRIILLFVSLSFAGSSSLAQAPSGAPQTTFNTAYDLVQQGRFDLAVPLLEREIDAPDRTPRQRARAWSMLAYSYKEQGQLDLAGKAFDRALRLMDKAGEHSNDYAATLDFYSGMLMQTGDFGSASKALGEARVVYERIGNHSGLVNVYTHTAELEIQRNKFKRAEKALASARSESLQAHGPDHGMAAEMEATTGWLAVSRHNYHDGVAAYTASLDEIRRQLGDNNAVTGWSYMLLGRAQDLDHNFADAARNMNTGLAILKRTVGTDNVRYVAGELAYSALLDDEGSHAEAKQLQSSADRSMRSLNAQQCLSCTVGVWSLRHQ